MRLCLSLVAVVAALASACGNPLYSPCEGQVDCAEGLRCLDLGNDQRVCTRPCTTTKERAGYPEGFDNDELFVDGTTAQGAAEAPQCSDSAVTVSSQDNTEQGAQNFLVESEGVVGVCRVTPSLLTDQAISGDSVLVGVCAPL
jgi:hypothetical protein